MTERQLVSGGLCAPSSGKKYIVKEGSADALGAPNDDVKVTRRAKSYLKKMLRNKLTDVINDSADHAAQKTLLSIEL